MKRILFCASTLSHIRNFHLPYLEAAREAGYEVWVAADRVGEVPHAHHVVALPFQKSLRSTKNLQALWEARRLLRQVPFDLLSTHTTLASVILRLAVRSLGPSRRPQVVNICHGYLFGEDDGLKKWVYLLPEKLCAPVTTTLLVMNREDEAIARRHRLYKERLAFIHGMGINLERYRPLPPEERREGRAALGYGGDEVLFIYAAELSRRKNQAELIRAFAKATPRMPEARLLLAGTGALEAEYAALIKKLEVEDRVTLLGHVDGLERLYPLCDVAVSSSRIEGLPFHMMEAMSCGLPVLAGGIKGHRELLQDTPGGTLYQTEEDLSAALVHLYTDHPTTNWNARLTPYTLEKVLPQVLGEMGVKKIPETMESVYTADEK